jgi:hypothetical protein
LHMYGINATFVHFSLPCPFARFSA